MIRKKAFGKRYFQVQVKLTTKLQFPSANVHQFVGMAIFPMGMEPRGASPHIDGDGGTKIKNEAGMGIYFIFPIEMGRGWGMYYSPHHRSIYLYINIYIFKYVYIYYKLCFGGYLYNVLPSGLH